MVRGSQRGWGRSFRNKTFSGIRNKSKEKKAKLKKKGITLKKKGATLKKKEQNSRKKE